jgi:hypothetical protein
MVRFIVVKPIHVDSNPKFDVGIGYLWLIIFLVVGDVFVDSETFFDRLCESQDQAGIVFRMCSYG